MALISINLGLFNLLPDPGARRRAPDVLRARGRAPAAAAAARARARAHRRHGDPARRSWCSRSRTTSRSAGTSSLGHVQRSRDERAHAHRRRAAGTDRRRAPSPRACSSAWTRTARSPRRRSTPSSSATRSSTARDRALATELVYGVLRTRGALERAHRAPTRRAASPIDEVLRLLCSSPPTSSCVLDRIPAFAAVDEAVAEIRRAARAARRGLRQRGAPQRVAAGREARARAQAVRESAPRVAARAARERGRRERGRGAARVGSAARALGRAAASGRAAARPGSKSAEPGRARCRGASCSRAAIRASSRAYAEGAFVVQEHGAQVVALALGARPGERVLDACAGRGQKTALFARAGRRTAPSSGPADVHPREARAPRREFARLGLPRPRARRGRLDASARATSRATSIACSWTRRARAPARCGAARRSRAGSTPEDPARLGELAARDPARRRRARQPAGASCSPCAACSRKRRKPSVERVSDVLEPAPFDAPELASLLAPGDELASPAAARARHRRLLRASFRRR